MIHTIETRLNINTTQEDILDSCVVLWSTYYRKTWKFWNNQQLTETAIYHHLMGLNLFTSRQIGSLINKVKTEHAKIKELSKMVKKTKQKFYQIPFGMLLNLIESKLTEKEINIVEINEAYTSKTSSLTGNVVKVQLKSKNKEIIIPNDFNGSRGSKISGNLNNPLGRGLFKDMVINKVINADINAAVNHIKVGIDKLTINNIGYSNIEINRELSKYYNPIKIKSNHEFDKLIKSYQIVDIQKV